MRLLLTLAALLALSVGLRTSSAQGCGAQGAGSCLAVHASPGCATIDCCTTVCNFNPDCCQVAWDQSCVDLANSECIGLCGASSAGDCREAHDRPACDDAACCTLVCAIDPACCEFEWDTVCVLEAQQVCAPPPPVECGAANAGSCSVAHPTPSCSNAACCTLVCSFDPSCCIQSWDSICVQFAAAYCGNCALSCPSGSVNEVEACGQRTNDPCAGAGQQAVTLVPGATYCGQLNGTYLANVWSGDRDVFALVVTDTNGDGLARVTLRLASNFTSFAAMLAPGCATPLASAALHVNGSGCVEHSAAACLAPGTYWVVVAPGTFPAVGLTESLDCTSTPRYTLRVEVTQTGCGNACNPGAGPCFEPHAEPGCSTVSCCTSVCATDPFCCSDSWDVSCAQAAAAICGAPVPPNDDCAGALPLHIGETLTFNTVAAHVSTPPLPVSCDQGTGASIGTDLWYLHDAERSGNVVVSTCGSATNLRVAVYTGTCTGLALVACNSSSILCTPNTGARLQFQASCDTRYYLRVGGENIKEAGAGLINLAGQGPLCPVQCPADIDNSGTVNGADIGLLLGNWGQPGAGDINGDGTVNGADLGLLLGAWGPCP